MRASWRRSNVVPCAASPTRSSASPTRASSNGFPTTRRQRVRSAVTDGLERLDWLPRTIVCPNPPATAGATRVAADRTPSTEATSFASFDAGSSRAASRAAHPSAAGSAAARREEERAPFRALARTLGLNRQEAASVGDDDPADQVRVALRRLPEQQRTVLTLQYLAGLSLEQVGALLGTSLIGARRASEHALGTLRRSMEEDAGPLAAQAG